MALYYSRNQKFYQDYLLMQMKKSEGNIYPTLIIDLVEAYNHPRLSSSLMLYEQERQAESISNQIIISEIVRPLIYEVVI
jgi:hypothetical protein